MKSIRINSYCQSSLVVVIGSTDYQTVIGLAMNGSIITGLPMVSDELAANSYSL